VKVVLFCGGPRLSSERGALPKQLLPVGDRPLLWHVMKWFAHHGHKEFVLCLGAGGQAIKDYFLGYGAWPLLPRSPFEPLFGAEELRHDDIDDWSITFVDTGRLENAGQRLLAVRDHLRADEAFLASTVDHLTDAPLDELVADFLRGGKTASFLSVPPSQSFHVTHLGPDGEVRGIVPVARAGFWINGGVFAFRRALLDEVRDGEELEVEPFQRLLRRGQLATWRHAGFWSRADTLEERQRLDELARTSAPPWAVWRRNRLRRELRLGA
jgi:glucose-1-phosphate cytidylyltransferase